MIGCHCPVCSSNSPRNKRWRSSGLCSIGDKTLLIDCGPDFREQALKYHIDHLDGVLLTHAHNDHVGGLDELRVYSSLKGRQLPCLLSPETLSDIEHRFYYLFGDEPYKFGSRLNLQLLEETSGTVDFIGIKIRHFAYEQMGMRVEGFRLGNLAYVSDIRKFPLTIYDELEGIEILILSALRFNDTFMHFSVDEAIEFSRKVKAKQTWLMHIAHELDHEKTDEYLPENIRMAYDGLELEFLAEITKP